MKTDTRGYKHEASGCWLYKEIAQPHITAFQDIFEDFKPYDVCDKDRQHDFAPREITGQNIAGNMFSDCKAIMQGKASNRGKHRDETMWVGPYCGLRDGGSFSVRCADWVLSRIRERTIIIGGDRMSFEIVNHDNGWSLVTVNHGQILGSVWLAYIKTDSIPAIKEAA